MRIFVLNLITFRATPMPIIVRNFRLNFCVLLQQNTNKIHQKMKSNPIKLPLLALAMFLIFQNCKRENGNETKISAFNKTESHNMGKNCMECHKAGGGGEGWFNLAGTVYKPDLATTYPNTTVALYTQPNGQGMLKYTLQVDGRGNFYSTESIDYSSGLYPVVRSDTASMAMPTAVMAGNCNSCHGVSTSKIWVP